MQADGLYVGKPLVSADILGQLAQAGALPAVTFTPWKDFLGTLEPYCAVETLTLSTSGATTDTTLKLLQAKSLILGLLWYVEEGLVNSGTSLTALQFGDATTAARFGSQAATANAIAAALSGLGSTHITTGIASATTGIFQSADASVRCTITGTAPGISAGKVRIIVYGLRFKVPV